MTLQLNEPLIIDNTQTLRLITEDTAKLITKLRHPSTLAAPRVRKEPSAFQWKATKEMIADGLTKALPKQRFKSFVNMIGMVDIKERLNEEKQLEDLREKVRARRKDLDEITVQLTH